VQFNVLEAMKHPTEDHSLFCIDLLGDVVNNFASIFLDIFSGFSSSLDFSFLNMSYTILDENENYKIGDIEDAVSLNYTFMASECDAEVAKITLGSKDVAICGTTTHFGVETFTASFRICLS